MLLLNISCKKGGCNTVLDSVSFRTTLSPEQTSQVRVANGWSYADGGNCGLIVYNTGEKIIAYDRCSSASSSKLIVEGFQVVDQEIGAKWLLLDGSPSYLSECSLRAYRVQSVGSFIVVEN